MSEDCKQYSKTDDINASSLNTFRINTFNVNGLITVEDMIFRHGQQGSVVDNGHGGGVCCGINADGTLSGWGYDAKNEAAYSGSQWSALYGYQASRSGKS